MSAWDARLWYVSMPVRLYYGRPTDCCVDALAQVMIASKRLVNLVWVRSSRRHDGGIVDCSGDRRRLRCRRLRHSHLAVQRREGHVCW
jgi:hypothetical protein